MKKMILYSIPFLLISILLKSADVRQELSKIFKDPEYLPVKFNSYQKQLHILPSINKTRHIFYNVSSYKYSPLKKFILIYSEERDFIAKYFGMFLGSMQKVMKVYNRGLNKNIYEIANFKIHEFNKDESRLFVIATKKSFFDRNNIDYLQLVDTYNGEVLLSLDYVNSARFVKQEGFVEKLIVTTKNDDEKKYDAQTGKPYSIVREPEVEEESSAKQPTVFERIRSIATKRGGKILADFFRLIHNKQKRSLIKQNQPEKRLEQKNDDDSEFQDSPDEDNDEFFMSPQDAPKYGALNK